MKRPSLLVAMISTAILLSGVLTVGLLGVEAAPASSNTSSAPVQATEHADADGHSTHEMLPQPATKPRSYRDLVALGYDASDAQTAISLSEQTGIPALTLLADRKAGKEWSEIAATRAKGMNLHRHGRPAYTTPAIGEAGIAALVAKGYARMDVLSAASIGRFYGKTAEEVLALKKPEDTWQDVEMTLRRMTPPRTKPEGLPEDLFDENGVSHKSRLTREQVQALLGDDLTPTDFANAEAAAADFGVPVADLLEQRRSGKDWNSIYRGLSYQRFRRQHQLDSGQPTDEDVAAKIGLSMAEVRKLTERGLSNSVLLIAHEKATEFGRTFDQVLSDFEQSGRDWNAVDYGPSIAGTAKTLGITEAQVRAYREAGYSTTDLLRANSYANRMRSTLASVLADFDRKGRDWSRGWPEIGKRIQTPGKKMERLTRLDSSGRVVETDRTPGGLTLDEVNALLETYTWEELEQADLWAARLNLDPLALLKSRSEGRTWEEAIAHVDAETPGSRVNEILAVLGADPSVIAELFLTPAENQSLTEMGLDDRDIGRALLIARVLKLDIRDVAALKSATNTWVDVATALVQQKGGQ